MRLCECGCGERTNIAKKTYSRRGIKRGEYNRFLHGHNQFTGVPMFAVADDGCWNWGRHRNRKGYGKLVYDGRSQLAHRWSFAAVFGPIPSGMQIDHLCRNPACINPMHLRLATNAENAQHRASSGNRNGRSRFRGVSPRGDRWHATTTLDGRNHHLGFFDTEEEAARAAAAFRAEHMPASLQDACGGLEQLGA